MQVGQVDLKQRDIRLGVCSDQRRRHQIATPREKLDQDFIGTFDDVVVGDNETICRNHKTRPQRCRAAGAIIVEIAEKLFEPFWDRALRSCAGRNSGGCRDVHNRRTDAFCQIGKGQWAILRGGQHGLGQQQQTTKEQHLQHVQDRLITLSGGHCLRFHVRLIFCSVK